MTSDKWDQQRQGRSPVAEMIRLNEELSSCDAGISDAKAMKWWTWVDLLVATRDRKAQEWQDNFVRAEALDHEGDVWMLDNTGRLWTDESALY